MLEHARHCPECGHLYEDMTRMLTMYAELDQDTVMPLPGQAAWRASVRDIAQSKKRSKVSGWTKSVSAIAAALTLLVVGTAAFRSAPLTMNTAGGGGSYAPKVVSGQTGNVNAAYESYGEMGVADESAQMQVALLADGAMDNVGAEDYASPSNEDATDASKKPVIIRTAAREIETTEFDRDIALLHDLVDEYQGYYEQQTVSGRPLEEDGSNGRTARMIVRVPSDQLDPFITALGAVGATTYQGETSVDISREFYDVDARIKTYRAQLDRLREMTADAQSLEDLILLEEKMNDLQVSIESLESQLRGYSNDSAYSAVSVNFTEVAVRGHVKPITTSLADRMKEGFFDSINWLIGFVQDMSVVLATVAPQLIILLPLIILVILIVRIVRRRKK